MSYTDTETAAIGRLVTIAKTGTGQGRKVANFLLAWWNAAEWGGFDLTDLASVDDTIAADMMTVCASIVRELHYPVRADMIDILHAHRPEYAEMYEGPSVLIALADTAGGAGTASHSDGKDN